MAAAATAPTDIDLVAIFDDLGDYSDRWDRQETLIAETQARVGVGGDGRLERRRDFGGALDSKIQ